MRNSFNNDVINRYLTGVEEEVRGTVGVVKTFPLKTRHPVFIGHHHLVTMNVRTLCREFIPPGNQRSVHDFTNNDPSFGCSERTFYSKANRFSFKCLKQTLI